MATDVGRRVRARRLDRGLTQAEVAAAASRVGDAVVSRAWLSAVELGEIDKPRADLLNQVAKALATTVDELLNGPPPGDLELVAVPSAWAPLVRRMVALPPALIGRLLDALEPYVGRDPDSPWRPGGRGRGTGPEASPGGLGWAVRRRPLEALEQVEDPAAVERDAGEEAQGDAERRPQPKDVRAQLA